jgi:hypothetical protein
MIVIHVTCGQRGMSMHVAADIQSDRQLSKGIRVGDAIPQPTTDATSQKN